MAVITLGDRFDRGAVSCGINIILNPQIMRLPGETFLVVSQWFCDGIGSGIVPFGIIMILYS